MFWYKHQIWDPILGLFIQEGLQTDKSLYKAMSVLQLEWYKEALYYIYLRHFKIVSREMCSEFGAKKVTLVTAIL